MAWKTIDFSWISVLVGFSGFFWFPYHLFFKKANKEKKINKPIKY